MLQLPAPTAEPLTTTTAGLNLVRPDQPPPVDHSWPWFFVVFFVLIVVLFVAITALVIHQNRLAGRGGDPDRPDAGA